MSIATQFRWKRAVNSLRFLHEEHALVLEVSATTASEFQSYYEKFCQEYLLLFETQTRENIIREAFKYWETWDIYSTSYMYYNICKILMEKTKDTYFLFILQSWITILYKNMNPNPALRLSLIETKTKINHILYMKNNLYAVNCNYFLQQN